MNCEECKKRPATVHLTKIFNNQKTELHLCEECARHHDDLPFNFGFNIEPNFSIQKFLVGLLGGAVRPQPAAPGPRPQTATRRAASDQAGEEAPAVTPQCSNCGMTYDQFGQVGLFGCSQCYQSFAEQLGPLLRRVQGNSRHTGKVPLRAGGNLGYKREIEQLRQELQSSHRRRGLRAGGGAAGPDSCPGGENWWLRWGE